MAAADSTDEKNSTAGLSRDVILVDAVGDMKAAAAGLTVTGAAVISEVMVSVVVIFMVKASAAVIPTAAGATVGVATLMAAGVTKAADLMAAEATKAEVLMAAGTGNVRNRTRNI
jgi:hypothetical protein